MVANKQIAFNYIENIPNINNRNIYNINRSKGVNGNETKQIVFNYEDNIPEMNMRNIHNSQRIGGLNNENKQIAFNYDI